MPALSLSLPFAAVLMRNTRSAMLEVLNQDYVRVARAKGLRANRVLLRHVLPNASLPILTVAGIQIAALPRRNRHHRADLQPARDRPVHLRRDRQPRLPVVQGVTLVIATIFVLVSLLVDVLYAVLDPRLRTGR